MGRTRPPYPEEYKAELVRLVREEGRTPSELARVSDQRKSRSAITGIRGRGWVLAWVVRLAGAPFGWVGGGDLEAVVFA